MKVIGLRRKIAEKMQESKRRIPHYAYVDEVDMTELEALRAHLNATKRADQPKLTVLPFLMRALVKALPDYPQINARFDDEAGVVHRHAAVHIGIATQTANGLIVPVVRHAEARDVCGPGRGMGAAAAPPATTRRGRATDRLDHHHHQPGPAGRRGDHAGDQPPRGGHHRPQQRSSIAPWCATARSWCAR